MREPEVNLVSSSESLLCDITKLIVSKNLEKFGKIWLC